MAILRMHSFDVSSFENYYWAGGASYQTVARTGARSLGIGGGPFNAPGTIRVATGSQDASVWIQFAHYRTTEPTSSINTKGPFVAFLSSTTEIQTSIEINPDGGFSAYRKYNDTETGLTILGSSAPNLVTLNSWHFVEIKFTLHGTAGSVAIKWDGIEVMNLTGVRTTSNYPGSYINNILIGQQWQNNGGVVIAYFDDLIIGNASGSLNTVPPGDARVEYLVPIGNGSKTQFTPLAGINWGNVDELGTANDADYNSSPDTGATDLFAMSNLGGNGLVHGVRSVINSRKDDAGYRKVRPAFYMTIGQGDTERLYGGLDVSVADSFAYSAQIFETSPDTNVAWTVEEISDLQFGYSVGGGNQFSADAWIAEF